MSGHTPRRPTLAWIAVVLLVMDPAWLAAGGRSEAASEAGRSEAAVVDRGGYPEYLSLADGLHVTGTPIEVDVASFRLTVAGLVGKPLSLTLDEVRALPKERLLMTLECPGFFIDEGHWTGVRIAELLRIAGLKPEARTVSFASADGSYTQSLALTDVMEGNILVAYQFEDKDFPVYHGFPLRIAAQGQTGSIWVKWLGSITVR